MGRSAYRRRQRTLFARETFGPAPAFVIPALSYLAVWIVERYRWRALLINLAGSSTPALLVAYAFAAIDPPRSGPEFVALLVLATAATMALNFAVVVAFPSVSNPGLAFSNVTSPGPRN